MVIVTSARSSGARPEVPAKMTSSILPPRSDFAPCSPTAQASASTTLDLPEPFGPTMQVIPGSRRRSVAEANDLKPLRVRLLTYTSGLSWGWGRLGGPGHATSPGPPPRGAAWSAGGEDDRVVGGDGDGVLAVRAPGAIGAAQGPAVGVGADLVGAGHEPRLDGDDETGAKGDPPARAAVVGHVRLAVHGPPDAVPAKVGV